MLAGVCICRETRACRGVFSDNREPARREKVFSRGDKVSVIPIVLMDGLREGRYSVREARTLR